MPGSWPEDDETIPTARQTVDAETQTDEDPVWYGLPYSARGIMASGKAADSLSKFQKRWWFSKSAPAATAPEANPASPDENSPAPDAFGKHGLPDLYGEVNEPVPDDPLARGPHSYPLTMKNVEIFNYWNPPTLGEKYPHAEEPSLWGGLMGKVKKYAPGKTRYDTAWYKLLNTLGVGHHKDENTPPSHTGSAGSIWSLSPADFIRTMIRDGPLADCGKHPWKEECADYRKELIFQFFHPLQDTISPALERDVAKGQGMLKIDPDRWQDVEPAKVPEPAPAKSG